MKSEDESRALLPVVVNPDRTKADSATKASKPKS